MITLFQLVFKGRSFVYENTNAMNALKQESLGTLPRVTQNISIFLWIWKPDCALMFLTAIPHHLSRAMQGRTLAVCGSPWLHLAFPPAICLLLGNSEASDEWSQWTHPGGTAGLCACLQLQAAHKLCSSTNWYRRYRVQSVIFLICSCLWGQRHNKWCSQTASDCVEGQINIKTNEFMFFLVVRLVWKECQCAHTVTAYGPVGCLLRVIEWQLIKGRGPCFPTGFGWKESQARLILCVCVCVGETCMCVCWWSQTF